MKVKNSLLRLNMTLKTLLMSSLVLRKESTFAIPITLIRMKVWMKIRKTETAKVMESIILNSSTRSTKLTVMEEVLVDYVASMESGMTFVKTI